MSTLKTNNLQLLDSSRNIAVSKIAEMNGGFSFRNKIIDGRFDFWYEAASQTTSGYGSDTMFQNLNSGSTKVHSRQPLVAGVDLPCIEVPTAKYFSRTVVTSAAGSNNYALKYQTIESVSTLSGKTVTFSFYAKADSVKNIAVDFYQGFGYGGSPSSGFGGIGSQLVQLSSVWKRYSVTTTLPSMAGKTIGTSGSDALSVNFWFDAGTSWDSRTVNLGQQSGTFDIACVQLEEGSIATPFEELPMEVSLMRVNRHFKTSYDKSSMVGSITELGMVYIRSGAAGLYIHTGVFYPTPMRAAPIVKLYSPNNGAIGYIRNDVQAANITATAPNPNTMGINLILLGTSTTGTTDSISFHYVSDARL